MSRVARLGLGAVLLVPVAVYVWIAVHRLGYPFELDWMEGGSVELTARVLAGHSLYVAPSLHYVGWTYTPLYYWVTAGVAELTGVGFEPLRLVSVAASLVSMGALAGIVTRETADRVAGLAAAGLFAAAYELSGSWYDVGRVDSLFVALILVTIVLARRARDARGGVVVGVLGFAAFFTKQSALVVLAPMLAQILLAHRRAGAAALATVFILVAASTLGLNAASGGWYGYYVFGELSGQPWAPGEWLGFWTRDVLAAEWPLLAVGLAGAALALRRRSDGVALGRTRRRVVQRVRIAELARGPVTFYGAAAAGLLASAWVSRLHTGGYANVLIPAYAATALLGGFAVAELLRHRAGGSLLALGAVLTQLALLAYPIQAQLPTAGDRLAGAQLLARLRGLPGPILVLRHPWYATVTSRGTFAQGEGISDVLRSSDRRGALALSASLAGALDADHVQAVVLDGSFDAGVFGPQLAREFRLVPGPLTRRRLYPLTDVRTAPLLLYRRAARAASASGPARAASRERDLIARRWQTHAGDGRLG